MKRLAIIIVVAVVLFLFLLLQKRYYLTSDLDPYVNILSNTNEAFIFIGKTTIGQSGSLVGMIVKDFTQTIQ